MPRKKKKLGRPYALPKADHELLLKLRASGYDVYELAARFGIKPKTVYVYLRISPSERP